VFAGTGLKKNDSLPGLVGYEYDKVYPNFPIPQRLEILAASPVVDANKIHDVANATLYTAASGARVFNAGTIEWSWGLDNNSSIEKYWSPGSKSSHPTLVNVAAQKITANILQNFMRIGIAPRTTPPAKQFNFTEILLPLILILGLLYLIYCYWIWRRLSKVSRQRTS
jgi:hypothetical protein